MLEVQGDTETEEACLSLESFPVQPGRRGEAERARPRRRPPAKSAPERRAPPTGVERAPLGDAPAARLLTARAARALTDSPQWARWVTVYSSLGPLKAQPSRIESSGRNG